MIDRHTAALAAILLEAAKRRPPAWQTHDPDVRSHYTTVLPYMHRQPVPLPPPPMQNTLVPDGAPRHPIMGGGRPQHPFLPIYKSRPPRRS